MIKGIVKFYSLNVTLDWQAKQLDISSDVENTGASDGSEVVQVYVCGVEDSFIKRPIKELNFTKSFVEAGEKKTTSFTTDLKNAFSIWDSAKSRWFIEKGTYQIYVGNSSDNVPLSKSVEIAENY
ncbi:hypothetical protein DASC09_018470 [Saccharomycopsis crataegensis]|uniref:beta-glucosidase n=1 Tax=Saccharomycopsis crataegensis TaxID=43959 RepID=A0AAV5QIU7_9ASCO|nr:hypothetical protein DASC09_018470 [Saccharomycopsis crataegensis]